MTEPTPQQQAKKQLWEIVESYVAKKPVKNMTQDEARNLIIDACSLCLSDTHSKQEIDRLIPKVLKSAGLQ